MIDKIDTGSLSENAGSAQSDPGRTPVSGVGEKPALSVSRMGVPLSRTSTEQSSFPRDAETDARDGRAPRYEDARYSKRRLPHFEKPWAIYAVTVSTRTRRKLTPAARTIVLNALRHFHRDRYELFAACVMPNHVHFLLQPWPKAQGVNDNPIFWSIAETMHSLKSFTAHRINKLEKSHGPVWEEEVFDRYIRSESDLQEKFRYICRNPWETKVAGPDEKYQWIWTQEDEFQNSGSTPVPGVGEKPALRVSRMGVPLSRTSQQSSFRRDAETHARDGRAPQSAGERLPFNRTDL